VIDVSARHGEREERVLVVAAVLARRGSGSELSITGELKRALVLRIDLTVQPN
jgi:hypothetical protein